MPEPVRSDHRRIRRLKRFLRYMPRRAVLHKYPVVGRFATFARRRAYLWSFRGSHLRPAFYAGSVLSLLPIMGFQLPVALALSLALRANFMVMGGLQFLTNPFTAAPVYYATHQVGRAIITTAGFGVDPAPVENAVREELNEEPPQLASQQPPRARNGHWLQRVGTAVNSLIVGGVVCGLVLGVVLDALYWFGRGRRRPPARPAPRNPLPPATPIP